MDDAIAVYEGVRIQLQPRELREGGWKADFTLIEERGPEIGETPFYGEITYRTRDDARLAALDSARRIINERY
jgi:hypothetical protein